VYPCPPSGDVEDIKTFLELGIGFFYLDMVRRGMFLGHT